MALLEVKDLQVYYGVIQALKGISFEVNEGEIVTLIGANGAGKTTTMQRIMGLLPIKHGTVTYEGQIINKLPTHKIVKLGMTQVLEGRHVFQELTESQEMFDTKYELVAGEIPDNYDEAVLIVDKYNEIKGLSD